MLLAVFLGCVAMATAKHAGTECTTCVKLNSACYNITHLLNLDAPFRKSIVITKLGILRSKNTLYYAFEPDIKDQEYYKVGYVNIDDQNVNGVVTGKPVSNFRTFDFDQDKNKVYLGGDGISYLDQNNKAVFFSSSGDTILSITYKGNVFFVRDGENKIVEKKADEFISYQEYRHVKNFVMDNRNNIVFLNTSGLFLSRFKTNDTVLLSKNSYFRGLTLDLDGVIYAWWVDGIYKVFIEKDITDSKIERITEIDQIGALTFDNDNKFLFTSARSVFRLTETVDSWC